MGIFNIFKKEIPEVKEVAAKTGAADNIIDYIIGLVKDPENIKEQLKKINEIRDKIRKLSVEKRESSYLPIYLSLERIILAKKPALSKEYFSKSALRKQKEFSQDELRKLIRGKFDMTKLDSNFGILFIDENERILILYEKMCQEFIDLIPDNIKREIPNIIKDNTDKNFLRNIKFENEILDFTRVNGKINPKEATIKKLSEPFKNLISAFYKTTSEIGSKDFADEVILQVYNFTNKFGYPLNSDSLQILPMITLKEVNTILAHRIVDYTVKFTTRKDLIRPQMEKMIEAETLEPEEQEKAYFKIYIELEDIISNLKPPSVKKEYTKIELRIRIKERFNIQDFSHKFKLLFLDEEQQVIELFIVLYENFLKNIASFWKKNKLQKFIDRNVKTKTIEGIVFKEDKIDFSILQSRIGSLKKKDLLIIINDLSKFLLILYNETKTIGGDKKADDAIIDSYRPIKKEYSQLPYFDDFIRVIPESILDFEKTISLSPKVAQEVAWYLIETLKKEKIGEEIKAFEEAKKIPVENQSGAFFKIYLNLQHYIIEQRPSIKGREITLSDLKEKIRSHVNVKDLEDKFQLLFLREDEVLIKLVKNLIRECILNFIDKEALVLAERELFKKEPYLKNVAIDDDGLIDFDPFNDNINKDNIDRVKILNSTLSKMIYAIYEKVKNILGEIQAKKLFEKSYSNIQKKYGMNLLQVLKLIPKGVLEAEKFELLGRGEIEKTAKEMVKIDIMKGEFMNIAAHELRTPLVPIITYLEMLLNDKRLTPDQKEKIEICFNSAKRESALVDEYK